MIGQWIVNSSLGECLLLWLIIECSEKKLLTTCERQRWYSEETLCVGDDTARRSCVCYNIWSADWGREVPHPEWGDGQEFIYQEELFHLSRNRNFSPKKLEVLFLERLVLMLWKYRQQCDLLRRYLIANTPDQNLGMWTLDKALTQQLCGRCCTLISNLGLQSLWYCRWPLRWWGPPAATLLYTL